MKWFISFCLLMFSFSAFSVGPNNVSEGEVVSSSTVEQKVFMKVDECENPSGSPVADSQCNIVAVKTGYTVTLTMDFDTGPNWNTSHNSVKMVNWLPSEFVPRREYEDATRSQSGRIIQLRIKSDNQVIGALQDDTFSFSENYSTNDGPGAEKPVITYIVGWSR